MNPEQRTTISKKFLFIALISISLIVGCSQSNSEKAYLVAAEPVIDVGNENEMPTIQSVPTARPTLIPTPTVVPTPTQIPLPTISIGYRGFSGERPTGLVV